MLAGMISLPEANFGAHRLRRELLALGHVQHLFRYQALACKMHLRHVAVAAAGSLRAAPGNPLRPQLGDSGAGDALRRCRFPLSLPLAVIKQTSPLAESTIIRPGSRAESQPSRASSLTNVSSSPQLAFESMSRPCLARVRSFRESSSLLSRNPDSWIYPAKT